jgi:hypothetical protein
LGLRPERKGCEDEESKNSAFEFDFMLPAQQKRGFFFGPWSFIANTQRNNYTTDGTAGAGTPRKALQELYNNRIEAGVCKIATSMITVGVEF